MPARGTGSRCRVRSWNEPEARTADPNRPEIDAEYRFDAANRLTTIASIDNPSAHTGTETRTIDPATGRARAGVLDIHEAASPTGRRTIAFDYQIDPAARRIVRTMRVGDDEPEIGTYVYDTSGRPTSIRVESDRSVVTMTCTYGAEWPVRYERREVARTYEYDSQGRLLGWMTDGTAYAVVRESPTVVTVIQVDEAGAPDGTVDVYRGNCADVIFDPCSSAFAPAPP